jgi:hypothetical protein
MKTRIVAIAGMALAVTGCATVAAGTSQDIRIISDPPGAECKVTRDEVALAVVTTPATVNVPRSKRSIMAVCRKEGHADATETIPSEVHAGTIGNIIAGGIVGIAVDAASGANNNYREITIVAFVPESFDSTGTRDRYFTDLRRRVSAAADTEIKRVMDSCPQSKREFCAVEADRVKGSKQAALDSVDQKKAGARIGK